MALASPLEDMLAQLLATGRVEVRENDQWLAELSTFRFEVRSDNRSLLLHLWSGERNLVRRVLRVAEQSPERLVLEVQRFGRSKPDRLEFLSVASERSAHRVTREKFRTRLRQLLSEQFPDERIDFLTTAPDLEHSFSGCYTRGVLQSGKRSWAVLAVSSGEDPATIDGILTYGLIWLHWTRQHAGNHVVAGLRLFLPGGSSQVTRHRLSALGPAAPVELYELDEGQGRAYPIDPRDCGNLATWLTPRREVDFVLAEAQPGIAEIQALAPEAISAGVPPGTRDVTLRFRGLEFARWHRGKVFFGLGEERRELTEHNHGAIKKLVGELKTFRDPLAEDTAHPLYRLHAERWLESVVETAPTRIDARLVPGYLYSQVPAFAAGDRGVIDLLGVTLEGQLAVIELKASEDIQLVLQAVDYWLRVRWHQEREDFRRYGYFSGLQLQQKPPRLYLVAPAFRFHPATDIFVRYLRRDLEILRVGLNEDWRRGLRVVLRQ